MTRIFLVENEQSERDRAEKTVRHLDELRSEFFIELSHQLRTPVTAMKLAMDGLFSQLRDVLDPSQRKLARISRRNIERIVALVENQLDLLQMMTGERGVCRRLVDLDRLLRSLPTQPLTGGSPGGGDVLFERTGSLPHHGPVYAFTDPDHLAAIIDCTLAMGSPASRREISLEHEEGGRICQIDVRVDIVPGGATQAPQGCPDVLSGLDFESRAFQAMVAQLGGEVVVKRNEDHKWMRIRLPRYPAYDRDKDFLEPARRTRAVALSRPGAKADEPCVVHFVRCDTGDDSDIDFFAPRGAPDPEFLGKIESVLSEGDAVIRGRRYGTIYLALVHRSQSQIEHAVSFLQGRVGGPKVSNPQTIVADQEEIDGFAGKLELV